MALSMAMVALSNDATISIAAIERDLKKNWPDLPCVENAETKDITYAFRVGEADVIIGLMPAPIPWSDLDGPCEASWLWPKANKELKKHSKHLIVTVSGELEPVKRARLITQVIAAIIGTCDSVIGVFWTDATLVVPPWMFREFSLNILPNGPPLYVWVDFRVGKNEDGTSTGFTVGLNALGHKEFENLSSPEPPGELRDRFFWPGGICLGARPHHS